MRKCGECGKSGHNKRTCSQAKGSQKKSVSKRSCGLCGKQGHNARTCPNAKSIKKARSLAEANESAKVEASELASANPDPVVEWAVRPGSHFWAPYGDERWSAVTVIKKSRIWATTRRVNPKSGQVITRSSKVKVGELVRRDPDLEGKDKPQGSPAEVFEKVRELADIIKFPEVIPGETPITPVEAGPPRKKLLQEEFKEIWLSYFQDYFGVSRKQAELRYKEETISGL